MLPLDSSARFRLIESVYQRAVDLPHERRAAFVDSACGEDAAMRAEVAALLAHYDAAPNGFLESAADGFAAQFDLLPAALERIGEYRIIRPLGRGGMGAVYEAEQPQPRRRVALKVVRSDAIGEDALRRLRYEAEVLARLLHPGIAQIYEFGIGAAWIDGAPRHEQPYFAMELVRGLNLSAYVESHRPEPRALLGLLARICEAVHHAHQNGVIHRDLKPGNIIVGDDGAPKVLDFGIARISAPDAHTLTAHTSAGQLLGTLGYMSPEQLAGQAHAADTRSDVYALGVIAYELLTGRPPIAIANLSVPQAIRALAEQEPAPAGAVRRELRGDIQALLAKAMHKEPDRRYAVAGELAADIRRFLRGEAIEARRGQTWYVTRRALARHRVGVGVAAAFLLVLAASAIALGVLYSRQAMLLTQVREERDAAEAARRAETDARQAAQSHAATADRAVRFMEDALVASDPFEGRSSATVRDLLDVAAADVTAGQLSGEPAAEMVIRRTIGTSYRALGRLEEAQQHLAAALALAERLHGAESPHAAVILTSLGWVRQSQGRLDEADRLYREARRIASADAAGRATQARATANLVVLLTSRGDFAEAAALRGEALELARVSLHDDPVVLAAILNDLGLSLESSGDLAAAEELAREGLELLRGHLGEGHPRVDFALARLAGTLQAAGRFLEAEPIFRDVLERFRRTLGKSHPEVARTLNNLGTVVFGLGQYAEAAELFEQALAMRRSVLGDWHEDTAHSLNTLGQARKELRELDRAEAAHREALAIRRELFGNEHPQVATSLRNLADVFAARREYAAADPFMEEAIAIRRKLAAESDPLLARDLATHGLSLSRRGDTAAAEPIYQEALAIRRPTLDANHPDLATSLNNLGEMYRGQGCFADAVPLLREALEIRRRRLPERSFDFAGTAFSLGFALNGLGRFADAEAPLGEALSIAREARGAGDPGTIRVSIELAIALTGQQRWEAARAHVDPALEAYAELPAAARSSLSVDWKRLADVQRTLGRADVAEELEHRMAPRTGAEDQR